MSKKKQDKDQPEQSKEAARIEELENQLAEVTGDLQRTRADFENYRKRVDEDKERAKEAGRTSAIVKLLPVIDNIERAISHIPDDLKDNKWAQGIVGLTKNLDTSLEKLGIKRIDSSPGTEFDPELHEAIQFDEAAEGDKEVIAEELQAGYTHNGSVLRHAMVKVTRQ